MNGWKNYETWNVTLWIGNDERLYKLASECRSFAEFRTVLSGIDSLARSEYIVLPLARKTPDGVSWHDPNLDLQAIAEWWNDTFPQSCRKLTQSVEPSCLVCRKLAKAIEDFDIPKEGFPVES